MNTSAVHPSGPTQLTSGSVSRYASAESWIGLQSSRTRDFQLIAARVAGRVIDRLSGRPVAEAEVALLPEQRRGDRQLDLVLSDSDGRFSAS